MGTRMARWRACAGRDFGNSQLPRHSKWTGTKLRTYPGKLAQLGAWESALPIHFRSEILEKHAPHEHDACLGYCKPIDSFLNNYPCTRKVLPGHYARHHATPNFRPARPEIHALEFHPLL